MFSLGFVSCFACSRGFVGFGDLNRGPLFLAYLYFSPKKLKSIFIFLFSISRNPKEEIKENTHPNREINDK